MKKKIFSMIMVVAILANTGMVAAADSPHATRNSLHSAGTICYQDGEESVVIDSDDLYILADRLDQFKAGVVNQLGTLRTYLSKDSAGIPLTEDNSVYAGHKKPAEQDTLEPAALDFDTILKGIAASQSIPLDPSAYGMAANAKLYKGKDGKLVTSQTNGAKQISIQAATAANLSAGTAAWVNGKLLLGTGEDMSAMYNEMILNAGSGKALGTYNISSGYTLPVDVLSAYAYVVTTAHGSGDEDGNSVGEDPSFTVNGGGRCTKLFSHKYARSGFNVRVALYHVANAPAGTVITGSDGLLFY